MDDKLDAEADEDKKMKDEEDEKVEVNKEEEKAAKDCPKGQKDDVT